MRAARANREPKTAASAMRQHSPRHSRESGNPERPNQTNHSKSGLNLNNVIPVKTGTTYPFSLDGRRLG